MIAYKMIQNDAFSYILIHNFKLFYFLKIILVCVFIILTIKLFTVEYPIMNGVTNERMKVITNNMYYSCFKYSTAL